MNIVLPNDVQYIIGALEEHGHTAYAVGGCVRDCVLGNTPNDWDVCTSALPDQTKLCFPGLHTIDTGLKHGTVTLALNRTNYEITTYRVDGVYSDNRRPDGVTFTREIKDDLSRRDFTINAMAYNAKTGLVDFFGGEKDLINGVIRCVGDAESRFREDALRIMRALRFASQLGFQIDINTAEALRSEKMLLLNIAAERIAAELNRTLTGRNAVDVLLEFSDVFAVIIPEITATFGFEQNHPHHCYDVWEHIAVSVGNIPPKAALRLTMLLHDIAKPQCYSFDGTGHFYGHPQAGVITAGKVLSRLKYDNATKATVKQLIQHHDSDILPGLKYVRRWLRKIGEERLRELLLVKRADTLAQAPAFQEEKLQRLDKIQSLLDTVLQEKHCWSLRDLAVDGSDIITAGVEPGAAVGRVLDELLGLVVDGIIPNDRSVLLREAKRLAAR